MEKTLWHAARSGNEEEVRMILRENKAIDVNWRNAGELKRTAIFAACLQGSDSVVTLLLARPGIDVNERSSLGWSPFMIACAGGKTACVRLLLKDARVNLNGPNIEGQTPLWWAATEGNLEVIKWWIAAGREMDLGEPGHPKSDATAEAKREKSYLPSLKVEKRGEVASLLERFKADPEKTRHDVRVELRHPEVLAAEVFALAIFLCDGLLEIKEGAVAEDVRFFRIMRSLPMDLQMILCHRVVGSAGESIPGTQREEAFKSLAKHILSSN
jgi:hypothetical protein